jgi:2,5-dichlorohydroquinone reductive dechlorinase
MSATVENLTADLRTALGTPGALIGRADRPEEPRFSLFHAANSICSQKVRVVLAQNQIAYTSHALNIFTGQTYLPSYIRLRLVGCERIGLPLVTTHTGSTSTSSGGCDPAVVPTLVDRQTDQVIVDSKLICLYLDGLVPDSRRLRPTLLEKAIDAELDIVDNLPNYQMLVGRPAATDKRPQQLQKGDGANFSMSKVKRCDEYMEEFANDEALVRAYQAKRSKELRAAENLFTDEAMQIAYAKAGEACGLFDQRLKTRGATWLMGSSVTMADLFWAVELLRMKNLGLGYFWEQNRLPAVDKFVAAAQRLESIGSAVLGWPGSQF